MQSIFLRHLTKHNVWSTEHYGFRTKLNTDIATYRLTTKILNDMNNKLIVEGIFCVLAKSFDGVNHKVWLAKLKLYALYCRDYALYKWSPCDYINYQYLYYLQGTPAF